MINKIILLLIILVSNSLFSQQTTLDGQKYIIVANKFDFLKEVDHYQTSSLTKFLLGKKGFKVFLSDEKLPEDLIQNRCLSFFASVKDESSVFSIKIVIEIKDCFENVVYTSEIGKSKIKDFKKGYQEAIRNAYESMEDFKYTYNRGLQSKLNNGEKEEIISKNISDEVVMNVLFVPKVFNADDKSASKNMNTAKNENLPILHAHIIKNGFQLVNTKSEIIFTLLKTTFKETFLIKDTNGIFYKN